MAAQAAGGGRGGTAAAKRAAVQARMDQEAEAKDGSTPAGPPAVNLV